MKYRKLAIRALFLLLGILFLALGILSKQWQHVDDILSRVIEYENGGLP